MIGKVSNNQPKYTVGDIYREAGKMLKQEMGALKAKPLSEVETAKMDKLARLLSKTVLEEMDIL